ncbi:hypothetical protein CTI12_AA166810 [Artemisia annua]|uniref:Protein kinase domain-containing protein n=1 Tax=Artemisia annua TaxID=35608 RepID=A0A2U1MWU5_ARTAN|nr:hypothetical protein CTI12_AA166810 [Artemisia annua]
MSSSLNLEDFRIPLEELKRATFNFQTWRLHAGYKGELSERWQNREVFIKQYDKDDRFESPKLEIVSRLHHENIISFVGYCDEDDDDIYIAYEYFAHERLDDILKTDSAIKLTWEYRLKLCIMVAKVLNYLHSGFGDGRVIHGDVKCENILLKTDIFELKVCGFKHSKLVPINQPHQHHYCPEELFEKSHTDPIYKETSVLNPESDVYSFGVLMFVILHGTGSNDDDRTGSDDDSPDSTETHDDCIWAQDNKAQLMNLVRGCYDDGPYKLVDPNLKGDFSHRSLQIFTTLAYKCISFDIKERPMMDEIIKTIEKALDIHNDGRLFANTIRTIKKFSIPLEEIMKATDAAEFDRRISSEPHMMTYRGKLVDRCNDREAFFKHWTSKKYIKRNIDMILSEICLFSSFHHENITPFIGYCYEVSDEIIIVSEYAVNGSLCGNLEYQNMESYLTWAQRLKICLGAARGLKYLHSEDERISMITWVRRYNEEIDKLIDYRIKDEIDARSLHMFKQLAYKCISFNMKDRPSMNQVVKRLEEALYIQTHGAASTLARKNQKLEDFRIPLKDINLAIGVKGQETRIGDGGFGFVYKGQLSERWQNRTVAIKCLRPDSNEKIIVYEFASNGSLDRHLEDKEKRRFLTWEHRLKICLGAARGLDYLHSGLGEENRVIHRDVKSGNILLDHNFVAKVCDFGLAKSGPINQQHTQVYTNAAGTNFYMDPVYHEGGVLRKQSDVYSFGVVMFELLSGMLAYHQRKLEGGKHIPLINIVRRYYDYKPDLIIDPLIRDEIDNRSFNAYREVAFQCISFNSKERPTMEVIVDRVEEALDLQVTNQGDLQQKVTKS